MGSGTELVWLVSLLVRLLAAPYRTLDVPSLRKCLLWKLLLVTPSSWKEASAVNCAKHNWFHHCSMSQPSRLLSPTISPFCFLPPFRLMFVTFTPPPPSAPTILLLRSELVHHCCRLNLFLLSPLLLLCVACTLPRQTTPTDAVSRKGLVVLVKRRRRLLETLRHRDNDRWMATTAALGLRQRPDAPATGGEQLMLAARRERRRDRGRRRRREEGGGGGGRRGR